MKKDADFRITVELGKAGWAYEVVWSDADEGWSADQDEGYPTAEEACSAALETLDLVRSA